MHTEERAEGMFAPDSEMANGDYSDNGVSGVREDEGSDSQTQQLTADGPSSQLLAYGFIHKASYYHPVKNGAILGGKLLQAEP